jgi:hypothetical protein
MPTACVIFACQRNHDVLSLCIPSILPLMQMFDTFIASDVMPDVQHAKLLCIKEVKFSVGQAGPNASWGDVARHVTDRLFADGYTNVLSLLDDFFFFSVSKSMLSMCASPSELVHRYV